MDTLEAIYARRSVKHFDRDHRMTDAEVRQLLESGMQAPTAFNIQHWRFVVVTDPELRKQIRSAAWEQGQVTDASILIVMCGNLKAWKDAAHYWRNAAPQIREFLLPAIEQYYQGREQIERDECMRSCGLAGQTIMLAAKAMGYESCPMDGFDFEEVGRIIGLPEDHVISFMIAVGKGIHPPSPKPGQLSFDQVVIRDRFPST